MLALLEGSCLELSWALPRAGHLFSWLTSVWILLLCSPRTMGRTQLSASPVSSSSKSPNLKMVLGTPEPAIDA